jgi:hypothetical protein
MIVRDDIPLGSTYDANGNELTYKNLGGYWTVRTYDENGNELTFKNSESVWCERTYDENGNMLTFKDSGGYWSENTYDSNGKQLTFKNSNGHWSEKTYDEKGNVSTYRDSDGSWVVLATDVDYILLYSDGIYWAGCRRFNRDEAIKHWGSAHRSDERAKLFLEAILNHQPD